MIKTELVQQEHEAIGKIAGYLQTNDKGCAGEELAKLIGRLVNLAKMLENDSSADER